MESPTNKSANPIIASPIFCALSFFSAVSKKPNPKSGTVTQEIGKAVAEVKKGKIDFRVDKFGVMHVSLGRVSFTVEQLVDNAREFIATVNRLKPNSLKGTYVRSIYLSSTMSPGVNVDVQALRDTTL